MHARSVLVLPAGMPGFLTWARQSWKRAYRIVGASSLAHDPAREGYPRRSFLPSIPDAEFAPALARRLNDYGIDVNYIGAASSNAVAAYPRSVQTQDFGTTTYVGHVALVHIDGNHAPDCVRLDLEQWSGYVAPHGWIVFDDHFWRFHNRISCAFVAGGALCLQVGDAGFK